MPTTSEGDPAATPTAPSTPEMEAPTSPPSEPVETPPVETPDTAAGQAPTDPPTTPAAASDPKDPVSADPVTPPVTDAKSAIDFLTGKAPKVDKPKTADQKTEQPPAAAKTPEPETKSADPAKDPLDEDPLADYTETERKNLRSKTTGRIQTLHRRWKETETKVKELEPMANMGREFDAVLEEYKVRQDLPDLGDNGDAAVAGAIKFQAAINRIQAGRGSNQDRAVVDAVFKSLDEVRPAVGAAPAASPVEATELEAALAAARDDFDYSKLEALIAKVKAPPTKPVQTPVAPAPAPVAASQAVPPVDADLAVYDSLLRQEIEATGQTDIAGYYRQTVYPKIIADLKARFPQRDPAALFDAMSPKAQYDQATRVLKQIQTVAAPARPTTAPPQAPPPATRPVSTQGTQRIVEPPVSGTKAAIQFLSG